MRAQLGKALLVTGLCVGCLFATACSGDPATIDLTGGWRFMTDRYGGTQALLDSQFSGWPGQEQDFNMTQSADGTLTANYTDQFSNQVDMWGTMAGGRFNAMWDVRTPSGRQLHYNSIGNFSRKTLTIDGWTVNTFDSEGLAYNIEFPMWLVATTAIPSTVPVGEAPSEALIAFVGHGYSENVHAVDIETMTDIGDIPMAGGYRQVVSPDGRRLFGTGGDEFFSISDAVSFTLISRFDPTAGFEFESPEELEPVAISPDGTRVYAGDEQGYGLLFVLDAATGVVLDMTELYPDVDEPENAIVSPDGMYLYIVDNSYALKISTSTLQLMGWEQVGIDAHGVAIHPSGNFVYAGNGPDISVIDTSLMDMNSQTSATVATIAGGGDGYYMEMAKSGTRLYSVNESNRLSVMDTTTNTLIQNVTLSTGSARGVTTTPDGQTILVATSGGLIKLNATTLMETGFLAGSWQSVVVRPPVGPQ